jgi:hypothetical protein
MNRLNLFLSNMKHEVRLGALEVAVPSTSHARKDTVNIFDLVYLMTVASCHLSRSQQRLLDSATRRINRLSFSVAFIDTTFNENTEDQLQQRQLGAFSYLEHRRRSLPKIRFGICFDESLMVTIFFFDF